ncbi:MAG: C25 family cysteine peptidase [Methanobacteriota archaeon]
MNIVKKHTVHVIVLLICAELCLSSFLYPVDSVLGMNEPSSNTMKFTYQFAQPTIQKQDGFDWVTIEGCVNSNRPGAPTIPYQHVNILLPYQSTIEEIMVTPGEGTVLPNTYHLVPGQQILPLDTQDVIMPTPPDPVFYDTVSYPGFFYKTDSVQVCRGYSFLPLSLYPIQVNPSTGEVSYYATMEVAITTAPGPISTVTTFRGTNNDRDEVLKKEINTAVITTYPSSAEQGLLDSEDTYDYVVITNEFLQNVQGTYTFQDLINSKQEKGLHATIVTVEDIVSNPDYWFNGEWGDGGNELLFNDTTAQIRNFIKDAYMNWGTEYVLLGGDVDVVPVRYLFALSDEIPSDLYYGCLDGSFNANENGMFGERGEEDFYAEVYVGRAPVGNEQELSNFIEKTLAYEYTDFPGEYLDKTLMVAEYLGFYGIADYGGPAKNEIKDGSSRYGYTTVGLPDYFFKDTLYDDDWVLYEWPDPLEIDGGWPKALLLERINNGVHLINHLGHANYRYTMKLDREDVDTLTNNNPCFIYSQSCSPGAFDEDDCIAEHFIVKTPYGAFAGVWNSRTGWGGVGTLDGPGQRFDRQFFDALFRENIRNLGKANQDSKEDNIWGIDDFEYGEGIRYTYYELNLFGDPELSIKLPEHNIGVTDLVVPDHVNTHEQVDFDVTMVNNGQNNEEDVRVQFLVDNTVISSVVIPFFEHHTTQQVGFSWVPTEPGRYAVTVNTTVLQIQEEITSDNEKSTTISVGILNSDTNETFETIQEAVNSVNTVDGHTILVPAGVFHENIVIRKNISLRGYDPETTTIMGHVGTVFAAKVNNPTIQIVNTEYATVTGFTITHENTVSTCYGTGVYLASSTRALIYDNNIVGNHLGVFIADSSSLNQLYHNNFRNTVNAYDTGQHTFWIDYQQSLGNHWSDFDEPCEGAWDNDSNGIVDTPYSVPGGENQDDFPLMQDYVKLVRNVRTGEKFVTIQSAIDDPETVDGDIIYVPQGVYIENVQVDKSIRLLGENADRTIIDGMALTSVVSVFADYVQISGFTIQNGICGYTSGIAIFANHCIISRNIIILNCRGIFSKDTSSHCIENNTILMNSKGIEFLDVRDSVISHNTLVDQYRYVVLLNGCSNNTIVRNNFFNYFGEVEDDGNNHWNLSYPFGGNYWGNYLDENPGGHDTDPPDGIWDDPYQIPGGNNQDYYPFVDPDGWY